MNVTSDAGDTRRPRLRYLPLILGLTLILPTPLIWGTFLAYVTRDFYNVEGWLGNALALTIPLISAIGVALLPISRVARFVLVFILVPLTCFLVFCWGAVFVCSQFGDCL